MRLIIDAHLDIAWNAVSFDRDQLLSVQELRDIAVDQCPILVDVKSLYDREAARLAGFHYWRL